MLMSRQGAGPAASAAAGQSSRRCAVPSAFAARLTDRPVSVILTGPA